MAEMAMQKKDCNVLLVDDSSEDRQLYRAYLAQDREVHYQVEEADSAEQADRMLEFSHQKVDCILLDYNLPDAHDLDLFHSIARRYEELPIIIITGQRKESVVLSALKNGAEDYLI
jgi:DNA-binding NtrC family response regulator